jgi:hypothetical protein
MERVTTIELATFSLGGCVGPPYFVVVLPRVLPVLMLAGGCPTSNLMPM